VGSVELHAKASRDYLVAGDPRKNLRIRCCTLARADARPPPATMSAAVYLAGETLRASSAPLSSYARPPEPNPPPRRFSEVHAFSPVRRKPAPRTLSSSLVRRRPDHSRRRRDRPHRARRRGGRGRGGEEEERTASPGDIDEADDVFRRWAHRVAPGSSSAGATTDHPMRPPSATTTSAHRCRRGGRPRLSSFSSSSSSSSSRAR